MYAPLESLNLYHNCIKMIPEAIVNLQMLTYLNIRWEVMMTLNISAFVFVDMNNNSKLN